MTELTATTIPASPVSVVNKGEGSATDFLTLVERAKTRVEELFQITLEEEFILLGEQ